MCIHYNTAHVELSIFKPYGENYIPHIHNVLLVKYSTKCISVIGKAITLKWKLPDLFRGFFNNFYELNFKLSNSVGQFPGNMPNATFKVQVM